MSDYAGDPSKYRVYWFARDLVASRYGSYATKETRTLQELSTQLERHLSGETLTGKPDLHTVERVIEDMILDSVTRIYGGDISKRYRQTEDLVERLLRRIETEEDIRELKLAIDAVVRTSEILSTAPSFGREEIYGIVDNTIMSDGIADPEAAYDALYNVDIDGEAYQLGAQREPLVDYVADLITELEGNYGKSETEIARIVSGIVQEYERRAGQSRASTAGNVLETALQRVFDQFGIPATGAPKHFGDLEIDNLVEGPDGSIGLSCKRTLRERFRQSLSRQAEIGVDEIWFVSLMMADVSREKLEDIHSDGGRIYVPRDSFVWSRYSDIDELSYTLRPANRFIDDVSEFTGNEIDVE